MSDPGQTHYFEDECPGGHLDEFSCEDFCQVRCALPGRFGECEDGALDNTLAP